jgi:hypothetical protein
MIDASVVDLPEPVGPVTRISPRGFFDRSETELLEGEDLERNGAERAGHRAALHEDVGAKARQALHAEREIELVVFFELVLLRVGENRIAELFGLDRRERRGLQRHQVSVDAQLRRTAGGDVEVGSALLDHRLQKLMKIRQGVFRSLS